jgi:hypothetical protein
MPPSIFSVKEQASTTLALLATSFFLGLFPNPEERKDMFLQASADFQWASWHYIAYELTFFYIKIGFQIQVN